MRRLAEQLQSRVELRPEVASEREAPIMMDQRTLRHYSERDVMSKCLQTLEQVCIELRDYLSQNEIANAEELEQVKLILLDNFGNADDADGEVEKRQRTEIDFN